MGQVQTTNIEEEMEESYINYAMSVIRGRAIPDVRDGLKPVQRRILYGLHDLGLTSDKPHKKSARIVGEVLGKYHPHGDKAVYDTMVNMAQEFSFRYPLVDGQGNFGSIDGDEPAAMRYTEARLSPISETFLEELGENTVEFTPNFDDSLEEPTVMPTKVPGLLLNGAWGISVGMTTKIPPHNLSEIVDALLHLIDRPEASLEDLMQHVKGPDFPTGAIILGRDGIEDAYRTGKGKIRMRAKSRLEDDKIIITEIPFQVKKSTIIERIADKVKSGDIEGVSDVRDESDREGMRIVVKLKRGTEPDVVVNRLFKYTPLERTYGANFLVIVDGNPRRLSLKEALNAFLDFRREVVKKRTEYRLENAQERAHILEGLQIALDNSQRIIELIREAKDREEAREKLKAQYQFTDRQADAILKMQLGRLTSLERDKIVTELEEKQQEIKRYSEILSSSSELDEVIKNELREIQEEFGDERRSLVTEKVREVDAEELIPDYNLVTQVTEKGQVNSPHCDNFKQQNRGGKGVISMRVEEEDRLYSLQRTNARNTLMFFTTAENAYQIKSHKLPSSRRDSKGEDIRKYLDMGEGETVQTIVDLRDRPVEETYCLIATEGGMVIKNPLSDFSSAYTSGIRAINTDGEDRISSATLTYGEGDIFLATRSGKVIRFDQSELRTTQRPSKGVIGMELSPRDKVISIQTFEYDTPIYEKKLFFVTERGRGKLVPLEEFATQGRSGKGNLGIKIEDDDGLKVVRVVETGEEEILIASERGKAIRLKLSEISEFQRYARGVKLMELDDVDQISSATVLTPA